MKIDRDICEEEGLDALDDYDLESLSIYRLGKMDADPCDDYWEELAS